MKRGTVVGLAAVVAAGVVCALAFASSALSNTRTSEARVVMPTVIGMRMDRATHKLHTVGLRVNEECSGVFGCIIKANWWICEQHPRAGTRVVKYSVVMIYGMREGEC